MKLRNCLLLCWIVLFSSSLNAASTLALSSLAQQGKHHEIIGILAPLVKEGQEVPSFHLLMLSGSYYEVGRYRQASEAVALLQKRIEAGDSSVYGADISAYPAILRGAIALDQGQYQEAVRHASAALVQLKVGQSFYRSQLIQTSSVLGVANALTGNAGEALKSIDRIRAVSVAESNLGPEKYIAMARIQMALKDFSQALLSVTDPNADVSPELTAFYDPTFQNLPRFFIRCKSLFEIGRVEEAKRGYDELLRHPQSYQYGTMYWIILYDRARIALGEGDVPGATEFLKRAIEIIERRRSTIATEAGRIGFVGDKQEVYGGLVSILVSQGNVEEAFDYVERAKSRALVDILASKLDFSARGVKPEQVRSALAKIDTLDHGMLEKEIVTSSDPGLKARNLAVARREIQTAAPELATLVNVSAVSVEELKVLIGRDEALVEYYYRDKDLYAFVLNRERLQIVKLAGERLEEKVRLFRVKLEQVPSDTWQAPAEELYAQLWRPLESALGPLKSVVVVAHGALHYLPFAALRKPDGTLLVDQYGLRFLPSGSVLKFLRPTQPNEAAPMLALGNPDLSDPRLDLKFAEIEARTVAELFPASRTLVRKDASETNFKKAGAAFSRIHFATHGTFQADDPLASGLYLVKDAENDGMLKVGELYSMSLNADLVTLSACETGLGKVTNGDDVVGLTRGFLYAGSRSIVASLWSVDDNATAELMKAFYRNLASMNKEEALRQAQIATRQKFPHPFFWAAFQLTGRAD